MKNQEEIVTIVDESNTVVDAAPRALMRARGLIHRATYILVFNSAGEIFVQKRTVTKDIYPAHYCVAAGGVVREGETYEESARRELEEELAIRDTPLTYLFDFFFTDAENRVWGRAYTCIYDGEMALQEDEVESGAFRHVEDVLAAAENEPFTPDGIYIIRRYLGKLTR